MKLNRAEEGTYGTPPFRNMRTSEWDQVADVFKFRESIGFHCVQRTSANMVQEFKLTKFITIEYYYSKLVNAMFFAATEQFSFQVKEKRMNEIYYNFLIHEFKYYYNQIIIFIL